VERGTTSRNLGRAVFALSLGLMTTELVMTRIFSTVIWYHFAFFAISVAMFGAGAAGIAVHWVQQRLSPDGATRLLSGSAAAFAVTVVVVDFLLQRVVPGWFDAMARGHGTAVTAKIFALFAMSAAPFFAAGLALCLAVTRNAQRVHLLYSADLLGAALGCVLAVLLLSVLGGPGALLVAAAMGGLASVLFALAGGTRVIPGLAVSAVAVAVGVALLGLGALDTRTAKQVDLRLYPPEFDRWNAFSRVTVVSLGGFRGWGTSPTYDGPVPEQKALFIDMAALTMLTRFEGSLDAARYTLFDLSAAVYRMKPKPREVCIIGAGGGKDVLAALAAGARRVTAAEINPLIVDGVVRGKFREFTGDLYSRPDVDVHVEDGRSFIRGTDRRFDVVLLSMVDTSASAAAGAFALTENSLYTSDAFGDFMDRLEPDGVLSVSTVSLPGMAVGARLVALARAALERRGRGPARSIAVLQTPWVHSAGVMHDLLVKPSGFTEEEASRLVRTAEELRFSVGYVPGKQAPTAPGENEWIFRIATAPDGAALAREQATFPADTSPVSDDRPFFFYQDRLRYFVPALFAAGAAYPFGDGLIVLSKILAVTLLMVLACLVVPVVVARAELRPGGGPVSTDLAYVACLGTGFMFVEIGLIHRLSLYLGNPTYTLAVVLSVILLSGGVGSRFLPRRLARGGLPAALAGTAVLVLLLRFALPRVLGLTLGAAPVLRALVCAALVVPLGLLLGAPYPAGLAAVAARAPGRVPWLWAVNSATSVLGSVLATIVSLHAGIDASLAVGAGLYVLAALLALGVGASLPSTPAARAASTGARLG
jgi:hypothetical protein